MNIRAHRRKNTITVSVNVDKYVSIDTDVEIEVDGTMLGLVESDLMLDVLAARGITVPDCDRATVDAAYLSLRADIPEPIRELVLACAGRVA